VGVCVYIYIIVRFWVISLISGGMGTEEHRGDHEVRCVRRNLLLEALAKELPSGTIRYSSKVVCIEESGFFKLLHLADGTILKAKVSLYLFLFREIPLKVLSKLQSCLQSEKVCNALQTSFIILQCNPFFRKYPLKNKLFKKKNKKKKKKKKAHWGVAGHPHSAGLGMANHRIWPLPPPNAPKIFIF
jgi:hypothetical protein